MFIITIITESDRRREELGTKCESSGSYFWLVYWGGGGGDGLTRVEGVDTVD